jgi:hypothetical protein
MIGVADPNNPVVYYATDTPSTSVFVPFLASTLKKADAKNIQASKTLYSERYQTGKKTEFDRSSAWWAFGFVANWMNINYRNMSETFVYPAVREWQPKLLQAAKSKDESVIIKVTDELIDAWWKLADTLVVTYNDGYYTEPSGKASYTGYPAEYLKSIGFNDGFVYPMGVCPASVEGMCPLANQEEDLIWLRNVNKTVSDLHYLKDVILPKKFNKTIVVDIPAPEKFPLVFDEDEERLEGPDSVSAAAASMPSDSTSMAGEVMWSAAMMAIGGIAGFVLANRKHASRVANEDVYTRIVAA